MSGRKVFTAGEVLQAADVNDYLMDQSVMVFAGTAARGSAIPSPTEGMVTYRSDDDVLEVYNGSSFVGVGGKILQVVSTTKADTFSTTSTSFATITGLSVSITPSSATSKILIIAQVAYALANAANYGAFKLSGGNTSSYVGDDDSANRIEAIFGGGSNANNEALLVTGSIVYLDSPATTSPITYGVDTRANGGTTYVNRSAQDGNDVGRVRGASSITVMEVAG